MLYIHQPARKLVLYLGSSINSFTNLTGSMPLGNNRAKNAMNTTV